MIISASRRTDIPAFYAKWFMNRIRERYVLVPNPYNPKQISRIALNPDVVDCIVFWTKNPAPMLRELDRLGAYNYYFQYTLNPYGPEAENCLPPLQARIETFKRLSEKIGKERMIWRYDRCSPMGNTPWNFTGRRSPHGGSTERPHGTLHAGIHRPLPPYPQSRRTVGHRAAATRRDRRNGRLV